MESLKQFKPMNSRKQSLSVYFFCCIFIVNTFHAFAQNNIANAKFRQDDNQGANSHIQILSFKQFNTLSNRLVDKTASVLSGAMIELNEENPFAIIELFITDSTIKNNIKYAIKSEGSDDLIFQESNEIFLTWEQDKPIVNLQIQGFTSDKIQLSHQLKITINNQPIKRLMVIRSLFSILWLVVGGAIVAILFFLSKHLSIQQPVNPPQSDSNPSLDSGSSKDFLQTLNNEIIINMSDLNFNVEFLSSKLGIDVRQLRKIVDERTSMSLTQYIQDVRLEHAMTLLTQHQVTSIKNLSHTIGIRDQKYFSRAFKLKFGKYPSEFILNTEVS